MLRCSVKSSGFSIPFTSFSFISLQRVTVCCEISTGFYFGYRVGYLFVARMCSPSEQHSRIQTEVGHGYRWFYVVRARIQIGGMSSFTSLFTTRRRPTYSSSLLTCLGLCACRATWPSCSSTLWEVLSGLNAQWIVMSAALRPMHLCIDLQLP